MNAIVSYAGILFNYAVDGVGTVMQTLTASGNELLLIPVALGVSCIAVGLIKRLVGIFR